MKSRELGLLESFAGLCSECKQKEICEVLNRVKVDIVAGKIICPFRHQNDLPG